MLYKCNVCSTQSQCKTQTCEVCGAVHSYNPYMQNCIEDLEMQDRRRKLKTFKEKMQDSGIITQFLDFNKLLGGAIWLALTIMIIAHPGVGKSTLVAMICDHVARILKLKVIYFSGEMSMRRFYAMMDRLGIPRDSFEVRFVKSTREIEMAIKNERPDLVIIDSLQSMSTYHKGRATYKLQADFTAALAELVEDYQTRVIILSQVNKGGTAAGAEANVHNVDVCLELVRGANSEVICRTYQTKNREADTSLVSRFRMTDKGLVPIAGIESGQILHHDTKFKVGIAAFPYLHNGSIVLDEVSVVKWGTSGSSLSVVGMASSHTDFLYGVIRKVLPGFDQAYVVKPSRVDRVAGQADLAIIMAVLSAYFNQPLPVEVCYAGQLESTGVLIKTSELTDKGKAAIDQGYTAMVGPQPTGTEICTWVPCATILDVVRYLERSADSWAEVEKTLLLPSSTI